MPSNDCPRRGQAKQLARLAKAGEEVQEPRVAHVELGRLGEPLLHVGVERRQSADHERPLEHVEVVRHRVVRDRERAGEIGDVEHAPVDVRQHGPEEPQTRRREADAERRQVPLEEGRHVAVEPLRSSTPAPERVHRRIATPEPAIRRPRGDRELGRGEGRELEQRDPAREGLGHRAHEMRASRSEQEEPSLRRRAIDHVPEHGEELGQALRFVDHDATRILVEEALEIRHERADVRRPLEIEVPPLGVQGADERALSGLARTAHEHGRKGPKQFREARREASRDPSHTS